MGEAGVHAVITRAITHARVIVGMVHAITHAITHACVAVGEAGVHAAIMHTRVIEGKATMGGPGVRPHDDVIVGRQRLVGASTPCARCSLPCMR